MGVSANHDEIFHSSNEKVSIGGLKSRVLPLFFFLYIIMTIWDFKIIVIFVPSVSYGFFSFLKAKNKSMPGQLKV
jgi:hypothetical protein